LSDRNFDPDEENGSDWTPQVRNSNDDDDTSSSPILRINNSYDDNDDDDDMTLGSKINMTDAELMDERNASPGVIRLTEEGLIEHTEKRQHETVNEFCSNNNNKSTKAQNNNTKAQNNNTKAQQQQQQQLSGFEVWKRQRDERKFYRQKFQERDDQLEAKMIKARERAQQGKSDDDAATKPRKNNNPRPLLFSLVTTTTTQEEGVEDMSVVPMQTLQIVDYSPPPPPPRSFGGLRRRRRRNKKSVTTTTRPQQLLLLLLEQERAKQRDAESRHKQAEQDEFERIQQKRKVYLEKHREAEAQSRTERQQLLLLNPVIKEDAAPSIHELSSTNGGGGGGGFTIDSLQSNTTTTSSTSNTSNSNNSCEETTFTLNTEASDQPCALCDKGERTHIAMPCMHYCFCEECVVTLQRRGVNVCPVCNTGARVSFTKVFF